MMGLSRSDVEIVAVLPPVPRVCSGPVVTSGMSAVLPEHAYLTCWRCRSRLFAGRVSSGAAVYACSRCGLLADLRSFD
jgi:DNA-directed RNA polymerase subunit RPC12/RpoP